MGDKLEKELDIGFSDEEKEDLEKMIETFNKDRRELLAEASVENMEEQLKIIKHRFSQIGEIVSKTNRRIDSFYEIIRLMYRKSELMNDRLDTLIDALQKDTNHIME